MRGDPSIPARLLDPARAAGRWLAAGGEWARQIVRPPEGLLPPPREGSPLPVVFWSQVAWDDVWQRPQELARGLARRRPVLFASPVQMHDAAGRQWGRRRAVRRRGGLAVLAPVAASGEYKLGAARAVNAWSAARAIQAAAGPGPFGVLTNSPFIAPLVRRLAPARLAIDQMDDFCAFSWAPPGARESERCLLDHADAVFSATTALHERTPGSIFLASGCAARRLARPAPEPPELAGAPRPRILYAGTLNDRLDGERFEEIARAFPGGTIVVVGPVHGSFRAPRWPSNARLLGLRPHGDLPGFLQHCDAGIAPYADNAAARAINPIKLLEYFACGLPVVATPLPDIERHYAPPTVLARPGEWAGALRRALDSDSEGDRAARAAFARGRSWRAAADRLHEELERAWGPAFGHGASNQP